MLNELASGYRKWCRKPFQWKEDSCNMATSFKRKAWEREKDSKTHPVYFHVPTLGVYFESVPLAVIVTTKDCCGYIGVSF